jgi:hypothetical protein
MRLLLGSGTAFSCHFERPRWRLPRPSAGPSVLDQCNLGARQDENVVVFVLIQAGPTSPKASLPPSAHARDVRHSQDLGVGAGEEECAAGRRRDVADCELTHPGIGACVTLNDRRILSRLGQNPREDHAHRRADAHLGL